MAHERPELVGALHDLGVAGAGQDGEPAVREEVQHLGGMVEADEVAVADHEERGGDDRPDLIGAPIAPTQHRRGEPDRPSLSA